MLGCNSGITGSAALRGETCTGVARLSSARAVKCRVKSLNERNPYRQLPARNGGDSGETAGVKPEEGGDDVKSSWPLCLGDAHVLQWLGQRDARPRGGANPKNLASVRIAG